MANCEVMSLCGDSWLTFRGGESSRELNWSRRRRHPFLMSTLDNQYLCIIVEEWKHHVLKPLRYYVCMCLGGHNFPSGSGEQIQIHQSFYYLL